jgi:hypothetical protein
MVSEPLIYSRRLASGLRTQKRERETLTLEKRSAKRGGLTFSSACSASPAPRSRVASTFVGNRGKSDARVSTRGVAAVFFSPSRAHYRSIGKRCYARCAIQPAPCHVMCRRTYARRRQDRQHIADRKDVADRKDAYSRSATPDNAGLVTCAVTRYDREDVADRESVTDRADVPDREIGQI